MVTNNNTKRHETENIVIYSPSKVAEILEVKETFVKRLLRDRKLKGFKMGRYWRISQSSLEEYFFACNANGNGKKRVSKETIKKFEFHAALRSQNNIPGSMEMIEEEIRAAKGEIRSEVGYRKIASISRLRRAVMLRYGKQQKLETMENNLGNLASEAYPDVTGLIDERNPDVLEQIFEKAAKRSDHQMRDSLEAYRKDNAGLKADDEVHMVKVAGV